MTDELLHRGRHVLALGRDLDRLNDLAHGRPGLTPVHADLEQPSKPAMAVESLPGPDTELKALIHCAGLSPVAPVADCPTDLWQRVMAVNLLSAAELIRLCLPCAGRSTNTGVRVSSVHPGGTATETLRRVRTDFGRPYDPDSCIRPATLARAIVDVLDLPRDAQITELHLSPGP
nr:SDR family NAD(P)-dependent oxidoreductase [Nocardiopsis alkaliphila]